MNKFGIQIDRTNKIQSLYLFFLMKLILFWMYFSIAFYEYNFLNITLRFCNFAYLFNLVFVYIFCYNTPVYREILLQFPEKYYISRTLFHFRHRAEAVLKRAARLSEVFSTARPSTPTERFYTLIWTSLQQSMASKIGHNVSSISSFLDSTEPKFTQV